MYQYDEYDGIELLRQSVAWRISSRKPFMRFASVEMLLSIMGTNEFGP